MATRRLKIAHMSSVHDPGDTRITHRECATLAENGYDVVLIARDVQRPMPPGVRHHAIPSPRNRLQRCTKTAYAVYRAAREEDAAIYHFHDPELIPIGIALRVRGKPVIFDVHEDIPSDVMSKPWIWPPLRSMIAIASGLILRAVQRAFSSVVAATPAIARRFRRSRLAVVQNYPSAAELSVDGRCAYAERPRNVLYVGEITRLRGAEQMVGAMAEETIPADARLLLVGPFEDDALHDDVARLPGWDRVQEYGRRGRAELPALLARARAGLLILQPAANHDEALPTKLLEYMAAGLPVVASASLVRCREIVESCHCGLLVDPQSTSQIAEAIAKLLGNAELAREMGERGRHAARTRYDWSLEAPKLLALYDALSREI